MNKFLRASIAIFIFLLIQNSDVLAQDQLNRSLQFRLADRIVRIAEPGEFADSVNVWGDVGSSGRYLIPVGTTLSELISFSGGLRTIRDGQTNLDWSKMRIEIYIHEYDSSNNLDVIDEFKYRFEESFPAEMWGYTLNNNQTITVRVKRKPSFRDYLGVFASTISAVASTIILLDRLNNR
ncbi:MAG: hypothetical protein JJ895_02560 [Balneolaceae bacterium]|nr:hypothetical protein [Balneolaceae bacterium]